MEDLRKPLGSLDEIKEANLGRTVLAFHEKVSQRDIGPNYYQYNCLWKVGNM